MESVCGDRRPVLEGDRPLPYRAHRELLEALVFLVRGSGGEQTVRLQPGELRPGRSDPAWRRAEAASAKHGGDGGRRDVDAELQELSPDPEVAPPGFSRPSRRTRSLIEGRAEG